jgi:CheY-like chemotaxis protein
VVDDNREVGDVLTLLLESLGARTAFVESAAEARAALTSETFDLLLSDLAMPGESGIDLLRWVRAHPDPAIRALPAVAMSAHCAHVERREALAAGYHAFVGKPCELDQICHALYMALRADS